MKKKSYIRTKKFLAALLFAAVIALAGCGSGSGAEENRLFIEETEAAAAEDYDGAAAMDSVSMAMGARMAVAADAGSESGVSLSGEAPVSDGQTRKLIRSADLCMETQEFDSLLASVQEQVTALGGYVESSDVSGSSLYSQDSSRYANLCVRIPSDQLDVFLSGVSGAANVTSRSESVDDVTLRYTDVESHKKSLQIEQERLWELMEKAEDVDAVIALEQRLSEIRYQLESYESQLRTYDNQVDYSTVNLHISEVKVLTAAGPDGFGTRVSRGFQKNLTQVGEFLTELAVWLLSSIPALLALAAVLLVVLAAVRMIFRRKKKAGQTALRSDTEQKKTEEKSGEI